MSDALSPDPSVNELEKGTTLIAQPGFFGVIAVTVLALLTATILVIAVNIALIGQMAEGGILPIIGIAVLDIGTLTVFGFLASIAFRPAPAAGMKILVATVAVFSLIFGLIVLGVVTLMLIEVESFILMGIILVTSGLTLGYCMYSPFMTGGEGASENVLNLVVGIGGLLFLLIAVAVVNIAMIEIEAIVIAGIIDVFTLAVIGWALMTGTRG